MVSKLTFSRRRSPFSKDNPLFGDVSLGSAFERFLLEEEQIKKLIATLDEKNIAYDKQQAAFFLSELDTIKTQLIEQDSIFPGDLSAGYFILQGILDLYHLAHPDWQFGLGRAPAHRLESYDVTRFNSEHFEYFWAHRQDDLLFSFILRELEKANIQNSVVVIDFFWAGELTQIMFVAKYLKENGNNTVVLDASFGDEQVDYTQWSKVFLAHPELFTYFDAYIVYQDYGKTRDAVIENLAHDIPLHTTNMENVVYRNTDNELAYTKPTVMPEEELFKTFTKYYHSIARLRWKPSAGNNMGIRMLPYKCYWSACHFCTINSSHLYPYNPTQTKRYLNALLDMLEENNGVIDHIFFQDEAVHPNDIIYFASEIVRRKIQLSYSLRTRFEKAYTKEVCQLFHDSGMHYCGIGLESATDEINISVNKGKDVNTRDKLQVIKNFDDAGICLHNYAIVGFPHENAEQIIRTTLFLKSCLNEMQKYACTYNTFGLNKGWYIANHMEEFSVKLLPQKEEDKKGIPFDLRLRFWRSEDAIKAINKWLQEVPLLQFLPWFEPALLLKKPDVFTAHNFWVFLDRTARYYGIRNTIKVNMFKWYKNLNQHLLAMKNPELLNQKIFVSRYLELIPGQWSVAKVKEWSSFKELSCTATEWEFLKNYDSTKTLQENLKHPYAPDIFRIRIFLKNYFLLAHNSMPPHTFNYVPSSFDPNKIKQK